MRPSVHAATIKRYAPGGIENKPDLVAVEEPLEIRIGFGDAGAREQSSISVTMRTPGHDFELALGFLFTEGVIKSMDEVESIKHCTDAKNQPTENVVRVELHDSVKPDIHSLQRNFYTTSSCGVCGKASIESVRIQCKRIDVPLDVAPNLLTTLPDALRKAQEVFEHTGGLHAVGLFDQSINLTLLREDVGRHNAMDKVIGAMLFERHIPLSKYVCLVSGRASFELVQKAAVAGLPVLAAVGAPSSLAIQLADECGMTLIGFMRNQKFNVYTHSHRIKEI